MVVQKKIPGSQLLRDCKKTRELKVAMGIKLIAVSEILVPTMR
jgi:hypothetical protein